MFEKYLPRPRLESLTIFIVVWHVCIYLRFILIGKHVFCLLYRVFFISLYWFVLSQAMFP